MFSVVKNLKFACSEENNIYILQYCNNIKGNEHEYSNIEYIVDNDNILTAKQTHYKAVEDKYRILAISNYVVDKLLLTRHDFIDSNPSIRDTNGKINGKINEKISKTLLKIKSYDNSKKNILKNYVKEYNFISENTQELFFLPDYDYFMSLSISYGSSPLYYIFV